MDAHPRRDATRFAKFRGARRWRAGKPPRGL